MSVGAIEEFMSALYAEKSKDSREIVGARVPYRLLGRMSREAEETLPSSDLDKLPKPLILRIYHGVTLFLSLNTTITFDHQGD